MPENNADIQIVQAEELKRFCVTAAGKAQLSQEHAELLADALVQADLRGVRSHGVTRLAGYIKGYRSKGVNPHPNIKVVKSSGAMAVMDGDDGLGLIVCYPAMKLAMDKAAEYGVGSGDRSEKQPRWHDGLLADDGSGAGYDWLLYDQCLTDYGSLGRYYSELWQ